MRCAGILVLASLVLALPAAAAPGGLDRTFSGNGWVRTYDISGYSKGFFPKGAEDVAIQPDGKILAVSELQDGNSHWWFGVYRWLPNGDFDRSFGSGGWVANDLGAFPMPHSVALQADGKILVGGQVECPGQQLCFGIVRYLPNGSVDSSFGTSGIARATFPGARCACEIHDLAVQRNGRIVAVGWRLHGGDAQDDMLLAVARFLPNGRIDSSFSRDGRLSLDFGYGDDLGSAVASRDGVQSVNFARQRYDDAYGLALQPDGRIVAAGLSAVGFLREDPRIAVLRLNRNGTLDRRFGKRLLKPGAHGGYARAVLTDRGGGIVVGGLAYDDSELDTAAWAVVRYRSNGVLDRSFGKGGIVLSDFGTGADWVGALAAQKDGKIVAAGEVYGDQAVARYLPR